jgi:2-dehydro-3-deoxygluconokinase
MSDVVTIGETMVLLTAPNQYGKIKESSSLIKQIGGAESNVAIALSRLGHEVTWISRVGKDPMGEEILYRLRAEGVDTKSVIVDPNHQTGLMFKERTLNRDPNVYYYRQNSAASYLQKDDIEERTISSTKILHVTGITPFLSESCLEMVRSAIRVARKNKVKVSFDPNLRLKLWNIERARPVLMELIKQADYFFPGVEEARLLLNQPNYSVEDIIEHFLRLGVGEVIIKLGPEGCVTANSSGIVYVDGMKVVEVDSVGAGDGFCAGYLSGVLKGLDIQACAKRANTIGALAVTDPGDCGGYPTEEELEIILSKSKSVQGR